MQRKFRLQKVLEYRERLVELEKNKLAELHKKLSNTETRILVTEESINNKVNERQDAEHQFKGMYDKYIAKLTGEKNALVKLKKQISLGIELQKKKVMEAIDRHKVMLKLKEKHVENYRMFLDKEEMKMIDELAITRSARNEN